MATSKIESDRTFLYRNRIVSYASGNYPVYLHMYAGKLTSNSSGLINLSDKGMSSSNCNGISLMCTTSNYSFSNAILWSNSMYYTVLTAWTSATPVSDKTVNGIITWFQA